MIFLCLLRECRSNDFLNTEYTHNPDPNTILQLKEPLLLGKMVLFRTGVGKIQNDSGLSCVPKRKEKPETC